MRQLRPLTLKIILTLLTIPLALAAVREMNLLHWQHLAQGLTRPAKINLNQADALTLTLLPGIGPCLAQRIVAYRTCHSFKTGEDLLKVKGIGPKLMARIMALAVPGRQQTKKRTGNIP